MLGVGQTLPEFRIVGVKPRFMRHEEGGVSAFETLTKASFPGKWKVIFFYPQGLHLRLSDRDRRVRPIERPVR